MKLTRTQLRSIIRSVIRETLIREYGDDDWNKGVDKYRRKDDDEPWQPSTRVGGKKGLTSITWPEMVKKYPDAASAYAKIVLEGIFDEDEIEDMGGPDPLQWDALPDDECFISPDGTPVIIGNLNQKGGSVELGWNGSDWDDIVIDHDSGSIEWSS